jgi:hypothetical protein
MNNALSVPAPYGSTSKEATGAKRDAKKSREYPGKYGTIEVRDWIVGVR